MRFLHIPYEFSLLASTVAMFLSLAALGWPVLRGVPWRQVREDLGLTWGKRPVVNLVLGPLAYLTALPLLGLALALVFVIVTLLKRWGVGPDLTQPGAGPVHPIIGVAVQSNWWVWVQVFLAATVAAPIVEEIMFRGALYRQLREATHGWGRRLSVLTAVLVSSFIFAVIHPQGWLGVPMLMALAAVFALVREWRGSLVPAMVAHGINNGVATLVLLLIAT
jgi:membrane protease YdiL (CAAX protease family)